MERRGRKPDPDKEQVWRDLLRQWRQRGGTVRAFCAEHGLSEASFYCWRRIIAQRDRNTTRSSLPPSLRGDTPARTRQTPHGHGAPLPLFVPLGVPAGSLTGWPINGSLEVVLALGRVVRVPPGFDATTLRQLLAVLEGPSC